MWPALKMISFMTLLVEENLNRVKQVADKVLVIKCHSTARYIYITFVYGNHFFKIQR